jgi:hypothetical protein
MRPNYRDIAAVVAREHLDIFGGFHPEEADGTPEGNADAPPARTGGARLLAAFLRL